MPFEKGKVSNPKGRPKGSKKDHAARLARNYTEEALGVLVAALKSENENTRVSAANSILDRGYGKPKEFVELSGELAVGSMTEDELDRRIREAEREAGIVRALAGEGETQEAKQAGDIPSVH